MTDTATTTAPAPAAAPELEPFDAVLERARRRIGTDRQLERADEPGRIRSDADFRAAIGRILDRAGVTPESYTREPRQAERALSAAQWRIERYVPERHRLASLDDCPAPVAPGHAFPAGRCRCDGVRHYVPQTPSQAAALEATRAWVAEAAQRRGPALALVGPSGVGKSHLAYAAVRRLNELGHNCAGSMWWELSQTMRTAKASGDRELQAAAQYDLGRYLDADALVLDEIRPTAGTEFDATELSNVLVRAHDRQRGILLTTQLEGADRAAVISAAGEGRIVPVVLDGANYRRPDAANERDYLQVVGGAR